MLIMKRSVLLTYPACDIYSGFNCRMMKMMMIVMMMRMMIMMMMMMMMMKMKMMMKMRMRVVSVKETPPTVSLSTWVRLGPGISQVITQ